jgi:hypothetical protein
MALKMIAAVFASTWKTIVLTVWIQSDENRFWNQFDFSVIFQALHRSTGLTNQIVLPQLSYQEDIQKWYVDLNSFRSNLNKKKKLNEIWRIRSLQSDSTFEKSSQESNNQSTVNHWCKKNDEIETQVYNQVSEWVLKQIDSKSSNDILQAIKGNPKSAELFLPPNFNWQQWITNWRLRKIKLFIATMKILQFS